MDGCIDLLDEIPSSRAVAFRMPCCDSMNSPSPRFYAEIFNRVSSAGQFLTMDSSVMNITTAKDQSLPRELVFDPDGRFVKSWGENFRDGAHGLHISSEGNEQFLYLCDIKRNVVTKTTLGGEQVFSLEFLDGEDRPPKTVSFAVNKYQGRLHVFGCLPCFCNAVGKEHDHVSSSLGIQIGAADGFGIAIGNHGIGPCGNYKVRIAAGTQRVTYLHAHLLGRNQFCGDGDPRKLVAILQVFQSWAEEVAKVK